MKTFYRQLQQIFVLEFGITPELHLAAPTTLILAEIQPCIIEGKHSSLDINYYHNMGTPSIIDILNIQYLVGRMKKDNNWWAIIDCSGSLARAVYLQDN